MSKVLLTGASGFVGSYLSSCLTSNGHTVFGLSKSESFDLCNFSSLSRIKYEHDTIIHCAAGFNGNDVDSCIQNEMINSIGSLNLCKLAIEVRCRYFVYISSISVIEDQVNEFFNSYGISKKHAEDNIKFFCKTNNIRCLILRFSQIYDSKGIAKDHQPFLYDIIDKISKGEDITFYGVKNPYRNYIHIDDVCKIIEKSINQKIEGLYHCVHPESHTILDIIEIAGRAADKTPKVIRLSDKSNIGNISIPNDFLIYKKICFSPQINLHEGIRKYIQEN